MGRVGAAGGEWNLDRHAGLGGGVADLRGAGLESADLTSANLTDADIGVGRITERVAGGELKDASTPDGSAPARDSDRANFTSANLTNARFNGANIRAAIDAGFATRGQMVDFDGRTSALAANIAGYLYANVSLARSATAATA